MDYVILDESVYIDGINCGNFINVTKVHNGIATIQISNTENIFNVIIVNNDLEQSIKDYCTNLKT